MGKIADVLMQRGELDEALRIRREEQLPAFDRLGDQWERAVTMGKIADVLMQRGELDEVLRIRREEELPVYDRLGDQRSRAVTMGQIADVLMQCGELDEALRIRREEQLPVYDRLGDQRGRAVTMAKIAVDLLEQSGDERTPAAEVFHALNDAWAVAQRLQFPDIIGFVGPMLARILAEKGQQHQALAVLQTTETALGKLAMQSELETVRALRAEIMSDAEIAAMAQPLSTHPD
jgi:predicted negative regulator of RcsB-dependent stress response